MQQKKPVLMLLLCGITMPLLAVFCDPKKKDNGNSGNPDMPKQSCEENPNQPGCLDPKPPKNGACQPEDPKIPSSCGQAVNPANDPNSFPNPQTKAGLTEPTYAVAVYNACNEPMWVGTDGGSIGEKVNGKMPNNWVSKRIEPRTQIDLPVPEGDPWVIASGRIWGKFGCDSNGQNCKIGQQVSPCPVEKNKEGKLVTIKGGCQPAIDTGFEIDNHDKANIYYDITMVNGFTGPLAVYTFNKPENIDDCSDVATPFQMDLKTLCPNGERLNTPTKNWQPAACKLSPSLVFGDFNQPYKNAWGETIDLTKPYSLLAKSAMPGHEGELIGCFAPAQKLGSVPAWGGLGVAACTGPEQCKTNMPPDVDSGRPASQAQAYDSRLVMYQNPYSGCDLTQGNVGDNRNCGQKAAVNIAKPIDITNFARPNDFIDRLVNFCLTDDNATKSIYCSDEAASYNTPVQKGSTAAANLAHLGPIVNTKYVKYLHKCVPDVYTWQYDDAEGLKHCPFKNPQTGKEVKLVVAIGCPLISK